MTDSKTEMKKRPLRIEEVEPGKLQANAWNSNVVSPDNEKKLAESLKRFGFFKPILVRELPDGELEVLGGEHRWLAAVQAGYETVPVINLGALDDKTAKEISLVDNGRYGNDDSLMLAQVLESIGEIADLATYMPYSDKEFEAIFSVADIALDDLELGEEDEKTPALPPSKKVQEFQIMRFKVPVGDAATVQDTIERIMKKERLTEDDSLTNAGLALVHLCRQG